MTPGERGLVAAAAISAGLIVQAIGVRRTMELSCKPGMLPCLFGKDKDVPPFDNVPLKDVFYNGSAGLLTAIVVGFGGLGALWLRDRQRKTP